MFLNLESLEFFCLPDNYRIVDSSLDDILFVLQPIFSVQDIKALDKNEKLSIALNGEEVFNKDCYSVPRWRWWIRRETKSCLSSFTGTKYLPGVIGLNNIKANDYCNVILQALSVVIPLRDFMMRDENYKHTKRPPGDNMFLIVQR